MGFLYSWICPTTHLVGRATYSKDPIQPRIWDPWTRLARFETVLLGERNLGQQVLEIVIFGYATPQEAEAALRRDVEAMIQT